LAAGRREMPLDRLLSTRGSGQQHADLAGPSERPWPTTVRVCVVIGDATRPRAGAQHSCAALAGWWPT
jgi:hypothetical protein